MRYSNVTARDHKRHHSDTNNIPSPPTRDAALLIPTHQGMKNYTGTPVVRAMEQQGWDRKCSCEVCSRGKRLVRVIV